MSRTGKSTPDTKYCPACETILPAVQFHRNACHWDGLASQCRDCKEAQRSERAAQDKAGIAARMAEVRAEKIARGEAPHQGGWRVPVVHVIA